ncbi:MAG: hypothetical protein AB7L66_16670 [Gemmatimonadales bacterium]
MKHSFLALGSLVAITAIAACAGDGASPITAPAEAPSLASGRGGGAPRNAMSCSVTVDFVWTDQAGAVLSSQTYQRDFSVAPDAAFFEDFSTATRQRDFRASVAEVGQDAVVTFSYFNDVSVLNSVDFTADLSMAKGVGTGSTTGRSGFHTTATGASGHHRTSYSLTCTRA